MIGSQSSTTTSKYKPGDIIKHTSAFLQSIRWCTNVPINGKVLEVKDDIALIEWSDGQIASIRLCNIMPEKEPDYTGL